MKIIFSCAWYTFPYCGSTSPLSFPYETIVLIAQTGKARQNPNVEWITKERLHFKSDRDQEAPKRLPGKARESLSPRRGMRSLAGAGAGAVGEKKRKKKNLRHVTGPDFFFFLF